jgi:hypothetical protein
MLLRDIEWERDVVERIREGRSAPLAYSLAGDTRSGDWVTENSWASGWEATEAKAKNANRTNAVFLSDYAIEMRKRARSGPPGALPVQTQGRTTPQQKFSDTALKAKREANRKAREEASREYEALRAERLRKRAEADKLWEEQEQKRRAEEMRRAEEEEQRLTPEKWLGKGWWCWTRRNGFAKRD